MRMRIMSWWRLPFLIFLILLLAIGTVIGLRRVSAKSADCLGVSMGRIDTTNSRLFVPHSQVWEHFNYRFPENKTLYSAQPGVMWAAYRGQYAYVSYQGPWGDTPTRLTITLPREG